MHSADEYRRAAADARRLAATTSDERERKDLDRLAAKWERLAKRLAREEANKAE